MHSHHPTFLYLCGNRLTDASTYLEMGSPPRRGKRDTNHWDVFFPEGSDTLNAASLEKALNRKGSFDTELAFAPSDVLVVVLFQHTAQEAIFPFVWEDGVWEFNPFGDWGGTVLQAGGVEL